MSILGNRVMRTEDSRLLRGGTYVDDLPLEGVASVAFVRSPFAHARVLGIDASAVEGAEVFTAADVDLGPYMSGFVQVNPALARPLVAGDVVRFVGDIVAIVVADSRAAAADAAELVVVEYDPLPAVVDPEEAARDETLLFPDVGTNVCATWPPEESDPNLFDACEVVVSDAFWSQRIACCPMEGRAAAALIADDGRLTVWASVQTPHASRASMAKALGLSEEEVRVIIPDVGGGFGAKGGTGVEETLVAWLGRRLGRPVRWVETRSENMPGLSHGRAMRLEFTLGGTRDGRFQAYRLRVLQDSGAYPDIGTALPGLTRLMTSGVYAIPRVEFDAVAVLTNTTPTTAYRGAGRPEAAQAIERAVDLFAAEAGLDPIEVRRRNFIPASAFPYQTPTGARYDTGDYAAALDLLLAEAGYNELRIERQHRREKASRRTLGLGLSVYVEITAGTNEPEWGAVEILEGGRARIETGLSPHGQGHATSLAMIAAERLGLAMEAIEVVHGDTDQVARGVGTYGSRSLQTGGTAVAGATTDVIEQARKLTADQLEANPSDVVFDKANGRFHVAGSPDQAKSWADLVEVGELRAEVDYEPPGPTWPFGAHLAVVEVDLDTGWVELVRMITVDDCGRVLNPLITEGQRHGGIAQGAAQALLEEFVYDEDGTPLTTTFASYSMITAAELPSFELLPMETPTPVNELGAKGIGESGTIGSTPAIVNAAIDALSHLGVRHLDMPLTPERVWRAIEEARRK